VLDADTLVVSASPPSDLPACLSSARIEGRWGGLLPPASPTASSPYTLEIPDAVPSGIVNYSWRLSFEGGDPVEIDSGIDLNLVGAQFTQGGEYVLSVELSLGGGTHVSSLGIRVRQGEAVAEPGKILLFVGTEDGQNRYSSAHFMDGETGFLSDPILTVTNNSIRGRCTSDQIVFAMGTTDNPDGRVWNDLFTMNHDGSSVTRVFNADYGLEDPDPKHGKVLFLTRQRTGLGFGTEFHNEPAILDLESGTIEYMVDTPSPDFAPAWPAFGPSPDIFAGGYSPFQVDGQEERLVAIFREIGDMWNRYRLHHFTSLEAYGWEKVVEGIAGVAWDPRNELIAYVVSRGGGGLYQGIAVAAVDGSSVKIITEGENVFGNIRFTASGSHIMFHRVNFAAQNPNGSASAEIVMVPRDGGPVVNLTRATVPEDEYVHHYVGSYCSG